MHRPISSFSTCVLFFMCVIDDGLKIFSTLSKLRSQCDNIANHWLSCLPMIETPRTLRQMNLFRLVQTRDDNGVNENEMLSIFMN